LRLLKAIKFAEPPTLTTMSYWLKTGKRLFKFQGYLEGNIEVPKA